MNEQKVSGIGALSQYFSDSVDELKKVSAPTRPEAMQATVVTVFIVVFIGVLVALMDLVFGKLMASML